MSKATAAVVALFLAAIAGGAVSFRHILDPGRSEANGITLNLFVGGGRGVEANDWFTGQAGVVARARGSRLVVHAGPDFGYQLVSRPLPVYAGRQYEVKVRWHVSRVAGPAAGVGVADLDATRYLTIKPLRRRRGFATTTLRFDTGSEQRVTIVLYAPGHAVLEVASATLRPVA
jgi:hypothetical protein